MNNKKQLRRNDLLYPELSYQIIGILFDVYNNLGPGQKEQSYQKAVCAALKNTGLKFKEQVYFPLSYKEQRIASNYFDFLVEDKIIIEIKKGDRFVKAHIEQVYRYLIVSNLKLGILVYFAPRNLHFKRIINLER